MGGDRVRKQGRRKKTEKRRQEKGKKKERKRKEKERKKKETKKVAVQLVVSTPGLDTAMVSTRLGYGQYTAKVSRRLRSVHR